MGAGLLIAPALIEDSPSTRSEGFGSGPERVELAHEVDAADHDWRVSEASFYGPGFYGNRTACGHRMTPSLQGVAHRTLPCGTLVRFEWQGKELVVPVVDRGPYTRGREWDLTAGACGYLDRCFTAAIAWTL